MLFAISTVLVATPLRAQDVVEGLSAAQVFELAETRRQAGAVVDAVAAYDALAQDADADIRAEARYRKGLMLADLGRYEEAALALRALLNEKPDALAARLELARMLAALGLENEARRELRQAQAAGIPPDAAPMVQQFAAALRSPQRFGGSVEWSLAPDSNINRATQARTLDTIIAPLTLSDDARAQSGLGVKTAGQAFAKLPLSPSLSLLPRVAGLANLYGDDRFNDVSASALVGIEWHGRKDRFSPSIGETRRWFGGEAYAKTRTVAVDWVRMVDARSQIVTSASAGAATYDQNSLQDGWLYDASVAYERAVTSASGLTLNASATRQTAEDPGYATWAGGITVGGWRDMRWGTVFVSTGLRRTVGDARLFLFPERREEWLVTAKAGVTFRTLTVAKLAPVVRATLEENDSTVGIYDYSRIAMEVGFTRVF
ncbi:MAG: surface lipoprotein assembly modifier [Brevundimonas sp.]